MPINNVFGTNVTKLLKQYFKLSWSLAKRFLVFWNSLGKWDRDILSRFGIRISTYRAKNLRDGYFCRELLIFRLDHKHMLNSKLLVYSKKDGTSENSIILTFTVVKCYGWIINILLLLLLLLLLNIVLALSVLSLANSLQQISEIIICRLHVMHDFQDQFKNVKLCSMRCYVGPYFLENIV